MSLNPYRNPLEWDGNGMTETTLSQETVLFAKNLSTILLTHWVNKTKAIRCVSIHWDIDTVRDA